MASRQAFKTMDVLRLEVEQTPPPGTLLNLIQNPDGELGTWGWVTPVPNSSLTLEMLSPDWFAWDPAFPVTPGYFTTEPVPVAAGQWVGARWDQAGPDGDVFTRARVEWLNGAGTVIASSAQTSNAIATPAHVTSGGNPCTRTPVQAPAGTVRARLRIDVYSTTGGADPSGKRLYFRRPVMAKGATSAAVTGLPTTLPTAIYLNILGPTSSIDIERGELNVGTLNATILDAALDPSQADLIKPDRRVRLMVNTGDTGWVPLFTGRIASGNTKYDLKRTDAKRARVTLSAVDPVSRLAQVGAPQGVGTINELSYVLEGAGVPWQINGSGDQREAWGVTVVSTNDNAKVLDQVAITRDSRLGYAWVDRRGVLVAFDKSSMWEWAGVTLDEATYTDIDVDWDSQRCINIVNVKLLRINAANGETVEVSYGPFVNQASVNQWGPHSKDFTVHGIADTEAAASAYAAQILTANATPVVRINALTLPITKTSELVFYPRSAQRALIDLYDAVRVVNANASINQVMRPTAIKHTITPDKWLMRLEFAAEGGVAPPQEAPSLASAPATSLPAALTFNPPSQAGGVGWVRMVGGGIVITEPGVYMVQATLTFNTGTAGTTALRALGVATVDGAGGPDADMQDARFFGNNGGATMTATFFKELPAGASLTPWRYASVAGHYSAGAGWLRAVKIG